LSVFATVRNYTRTESRYISPRRRNSDERKEIANDGNIAKGVSIESNEEERRTFEFSAVQRKRKRQAYIERKKANSIVMDVVYYSHNLSRMPSSTTEARQASSSSRGLGAADGGRKPPVERWSPKPSPS